ncbi:hypothetical protein LPB072_12230 [Hydrogenophaga crassostreae]|uniref:Enterobactin synthase component D n=1 Tax=Hydrogenophaga crassostreae TaxID=1763535 RepID=A0A1D8NWM9_9BURK|nr:hypothetical protein LPB072_12230 [Hydrogenophaga crassostreae]
MSSALGPLVGVAISNVSGDPQWLYPEEAQSVAKAVPKRQKEFAAGRKAARCAMRAIGWQDMPVPCNADRSPAWPEGLVGSISHSRQACVAIVGRKAHVKSVGIDIEDHFPIEPELWHTICTPQELETVNQLDRADRGQWVTRLFSAKEAFYKWQYPLTGRFLEFQDVAITMENSCTSFEARCLFSNPMHTGFKRAWGRYVIEQALVISVVV